MLKNWHSVKFTHKFLHRIGFKVRFKPTSCKKLLGIHEGGEYKKQFYDIDPPKVTICVCLEKRVLMTA